VIAGSVYARRASRIDPANLLPTASRSAIAFSVLDDRGVESRDEFEGGGLAFDEVGEEIRVLRDQGAELVEERLLRLELLAERKTRVAVHDSLQAARARREVAALTVQRHGY
jgi:hypothetical protein